MSVTEEQEIALSFDAELVTDPVGVELTAEVSETVSSEMRDALLRDIRDRLVGQQGNLVFQSVRVANGTLESYGGRNDYSTDPIRESVEILETDLSNTSFHVRWGWTHEAAGYMQFGVSPHTIDGDPLLSFIWEDAPRGVREMFSDTERVGGDPRVFFESVDHPGIPAARYVQAGINWLRDELS